MAGALVVIFVGFKNAWQEIRDLVSLMSMILLSNTLFIPYLLFSSIPLPYGQKRLSKFPQTHAF
jgi:hypothetical protein